MVFTPMPSPNSLHDRQPTGTYLPIWNLTTTTEPAMAKRSIYSRYATDPPTPMSALANTVPTSLESVSLLTPSAGSTHSTVATGEASAEWSDWPPLIAHFLLAWLLFAWIAAALVFLSQVRDLWETGWLKKGHKRVQEPVSPTMPTVEPPGTTSSEARATGLGISIPMTGLQPPTPRLRQPRSFEDEDSLSVLRPGSAAAPSKSFTAPLPSARSFLSLSGLNTLSRDDRSSSSSDLESGLHTPVDPEQLARGEQMLRLEPDDDGPRGLAGFLESVNVAIEYAAGKLAKATYDHVDRPEEGLLLPIRDEERERPGVVVD